MKRFFTYFFRLLGRISPGQKLYYLAYATCISAVYLGYTLLPLLYGRIVDRVTQGVPFQRPLLWYVVLTAVSIALFRLWSLGNLSVQRRAKLQLSSRLFRLLLANRRDDSALFTLHLESAGNLFLDFVYTIPSELLAFAASFAVIALCSPAIAGLMALGVAAFLLLTRLRERWVLPAQEEQQTANRQMYDLLDGLIRGAQDLQVLDRLDWARRRLSQSRRTLEQTARRYSARSELVSLGHEVNTWLLPCLATLLALCQLLEGRLTLGVCLAVIQFANLLNDQFISIHQNVSYLMDFVPHLERLEEAFSLPSAPRSPAVYRDLPGDTLLEVRDLSFSYGERQLFSHLTFSVRRGETLTVRGESGCGKSTLLSILSGYLTPTGGSFALQRGTTLGVLSQQPHLFHRTLRENLLIASPDATPQQMTQALDRAGLGDYWRSLPQGLDTPLGEGGSALSGGQRVRLGLARILLQGANLVLLDEPLTNLDLPQKESILRDLKGFLTGRACILVTHEEEVARLGSKQLLLGPSPHPTPQPSPGCGKAGAQ